MSETFDTPQSRNEAILQNILGAENELGEPQSRIEELLQQILEQGSGGGKKLFEHNIFITKKEPTDPNIGVYLSLITDTEDQLDISDIQTIIKERSSGDGRWIACGYDIYDNEEKNVLSIYGGGSTSLNIQLGIVGSTNSISRSKSTIKIIDTVTEL